MTPDRLARLRAKNAAYHALSKCDLALRRARHGNGLTTAQVRERERLAQEYRVALAAVRGGKQWQRKAV